jgi:uncharacterized protein (TIGR03084 family)
MNPLQGLCDDLAAEHAELDAIVAGLDESTWQEPTPAEGWSILDSIVHLALTDAHAARAAAEPEAFVAARELRTRETARREFEEARARASRDVLETWRLNRATLLEALRGLDPKTRVPWFGPPMSAMSHASARLMETWAHGQDVADALGISRVDTPRLRHIAHLGVRARPYSYSVRGLSEPVWDVYVELSGPEADLWRWGDVSASDRVMGSARDFCLVVVQRRHVDDTQLEYAGQHAREWLLIAQAFAGQPGAGRQPGQFRIENTRRTA